MSGTAEPVPLGGSARVLMLSTVVMGAAAAAVLALGTQDARLLRLGVVAALWAALFAAFSTARARREINSRAAQADQLRAVYQLELEREVAARREHALTVERALRGRAEPSAPSEMAQLRAELAAMRSNLEQLLGGSPQVERVTLRAESARLLPSPAQPRFDEGRSRAAAATADRARPAVAAAMINAKPSPTGAEPGFGPGRSPASTWAAAPYPTDRHTSNGEFLNGGIPNGQGRHGVPSRPRLGSNNNGDGSHHDGTGARQAPAGTPTAGGTQRTVSDLLAAHGAAAVPRRRRVHKDTRSA
ncbi:MAG: DUF6779 domain-containing protein [Pseudonocardiaceae bacterium]